MLKGWIKLHRKIDENPLLCRDKTAFYVFVKLLLRADEHGEIRTGRIKLAEALEMKDSTLYKTLQRMKKEQLINISSNNKFSVINILKWSDYQQAVTTKSTPRSQQNNTIIRIENKNNILTNVSIGDMESADYREHISKLYYDVIRVLGLPVRNHKNVQSKINEMALMPDRPKVVKYLTFMRDSYATTEWAYKPSVSEALDIHAQMVKIMRTFVVAQNGSSKGNLGRIE